ncbi:MAG: biotin synthase BioB [Clostridiales bacterium]|nr:biotin synthase BioB [Clostridiales bacterium]
MERHTLTYCTEKVLAGESLDREEALALWPAGLEPLCRAADEIRRRFCGSRFDLCAIVNGKSGRCGEDCKFCAQSACYGGHPEAYELLDTERILREAVYNADRGVLRFAVVTSGRRLTDEEVDRLCESYRAIGARTGLFLCASCGLLTAGQFARLRAAGVSRYHNNLETSRRYFPAVCSTHTYDQKLYTIQAAREAGLQVCSGGIIGMGETPADRIDLALELRELGVDSVPINVLNPIPGTPFEGLRPLDEEEVRRTVAVFRFLLPGATLRMAGGRGLLPRRGEGCFTAGANAAITGDMLTTAGVGVAADREMLERLGYEARL